MCMHVGRSQVLIVIRCAFDRPSVDSRDGRVGNTRGRPKNRDCCWKSLHRDARTATSSHTPLAKVRKCVTLAVNLPDIHCWRRVQHSIYRAGLSLATRARVISVHYLVCFFQGGLFCLICEQSQFILFTDLYVGTLAWNFFCDCEKSSATVKGYEDSVM